MDNANEAVLMATHGMDIEDIATELGVPIDTVYKWLHDEGVIEAIRDQRNKRIVLAYNKGWAVEKMVRVMGVSAGTIYNVLHAHGVTMRRDRVQRTEEIEACIISDYTSGVKIAAICARYKCSITFLYSTLNEYGVPKRRQ